jgi:hypothetical protein
MGMDRGRLVKSSFFPGEVISPASLKKVYAEVTKVTSNVLESHIFLKDMSSLFVIFIYFWIFNHYSVASMLHITTIALLFL